MTGAGKPGVWVWGRGRGLAPTASAAPAEAAEPAVSAALVQAMRQDLGLDEQQAKTRIRQEATATRIASDATTAAGDAYGGSWFDAAKGKLVVALTDQAKARAVRATGAETTTAKHSAAKLASVKDGIDGLSKAKAVPAGVTAWRVDARQ